MRLILYNNRIKTDQDLDSWYYLSKLSKLLSSSFQNPPRPSLNLSVQFSVPRSRMESIKKVQYQEEASILCRFPTLYWKLYFSLVFLSSVLQHARYRLQPLILTSSFEVSGLVSVSPHYPRLRPRPPQARLLEIDSSSFPSLYPLDPPYRDLPSSLPTPDQIHQQP